MSNHSPPQAELNLTQALSRACADLVETYDWNGIDVIDARTESEETKRVDAARDGLSEEETEKYITDYCCAMFQLDLYGLGCDMPYVTYEVEEWRIQ